MTKSMIPIVYYPLKILFVDDNLKLLKMLANEFKKEYNIQTVASSSEAIQIINNQLPIEWDLFTDVTDLDPDFSQHESQISKITLNISNVLQLANDLDKYEKIGILVTDHTMPEINGIELCEIISKSQIRKILLTGNVDISKAISALNNQVIDCYLAKDSDNILLEIAHYIKKLHFRYFNHLTALISEVESNTKLAFLSDPTFIELFNKIILEYNIKEHYLIDSNGSFLLIDKFQKRFVLLIHNDNSLDEFCEYCKDEYSVSALINRVKTREIIPFFGINTDPTTVDISIWNNYFYEAKTYTKFYWNVITI